MRTLLRRFVPGAAALSCALVLLVAGSRSASTAEAPARLGYDPDTRRLIFVGAPAGRPLASAATGAALRSPEQNGLSFIRAHASAMGLRNPDEELRAFRTSNRKDGRAVVRYHQVHEGVPVFGADVVVNTTATGGLLAMSAKVSSGLSLDTHPTVTPEDAVATAVAAVAKYEHVDAAHLVATTPALWIFDARLLIPDGRPPVLAWRVEVSDGSGIRELVMVDAKRRAVVVHFNQIDRGWRKSAATAPGADAGGGGGGTAPLLVAGPALISVYDMLHACEPDDDYCYPASYNSLPGTPVCTEADPGSCSDPDAQAAYAYLGDTHAFYAAHHDRDSIDGAGLRLVASVHYGLGYENAFWDGSQMVFGDGYSAADDVVGHELTHGVTQYESGLIYWGQPGAINESFSDVWGELIDQENGSGNDIASVKWLMGEDLPGDGAIRSMKNPPAFGDPDSMTSPKYSTASSDSYGVHTNSGVNNKAAYLMVDGGVFNGKTVAALGITKVADVYYEVQTNLLGSGASYIDLYYALYQACLNVVGKDGITPTDCESVRAATDAVKMNMTKSATVYPTADYCPVGQSVSPVDLFNDDLEGGSTNWTFGSLQGSSQWTLDTTRYDSSSGSNALYWAGPWDVSDSYAAMSSDVVIPTGARPYLLFNHDYGFDTEGSTYYDGGVVEYSTDGGSTWTDLSAKFSAGKNYVGTVQSAYSNPIGGRKAFAGSTVNYTESRYSLSTLAGKSFRVRFRAGSDDVVESWGWYVDDVRIYNCVSIPSLPLLLAPVSNGLVTDYTPRLDWSDAKPDLASYDVQVATDAAFASLVYDETGVAVSEFTVPSDLTPNTKYYWRVRALNAGGVAAGWTTARTFRTALEPPVLSAPADGATVQSRRPTFDWADVAGATGFTLQASKVSTFASILLTGTVTTPTSTYTPTADLAATTVLFWRVRANGANGPSTWSAVRTLTTGNPPSVPMLVAPASNALTIDLRPRLDWSQSTVPTGTAFDAYEVVVDDNADFSSPAINAFPAGVTASEYTPAADLPANSKYYWRVRSRSTAGDQSAWSAVRYFRTAMTPPGLSAPTDGANVHSRRPTFDWADVAGATGYTLQASKVATFAPIALTGNVATAISTFTPTVDLVANTLYYWRVRANGPNGPSAWSAVRTLTTGNPPSVPALLLPASNALTTDLTPRLDWSTSTVPAGTTFDSYELLVDDNPDFASPEISASTVGATASEYTPGADLAANTKYYWKVRSTNADTDASAWSALRYFRTALTPPLLSAPTDGANVHSRRPTFDWADVAGATGYTLQASKVATFAPIALTGNVTTATSTFAPTVDLTANTLYYWRVRANGPNGPSAWSAVRTISTSNPPSVPVLVSPALNLLTIDLGPRFDWSASTVPPGTSFQSYELLVDDNPDFASPEISVSTVGVTASEYTPGADLAANTKYYWKVRSTNTDGDESAWSAVRYFRTVMTPPVLSAPLDGANVHTRRPTFDWADVAGATGYTIQASKVSTFAPIALTGNVTTAISTFTPTVDLTANTLYYWRVRANGPNGPSEWSAVRTLMTGNPPSVPTLVSPALNAITIDTTPRFDWSQSTVPTGTTFDSYELSVDDNADFSSPEFGFLIPGPTASEYTPTTHLAGNTQYYWRVRSWNTDGDVSAWSAVRYFRTAP